MDGAGAAPAVDALPCDLVLAERRHRIGPHRQGLRRNTFASSTRCSTRPGVERATICGISFGGFVALRYAAVRPARVEALVLASSPAPGWHPNPQQARWIARPWLSAPAFVASSPFRLWPEVRATYPRFAARIRFFARQGLRAAASPMIPGLMARRIREAERLDFRSGLRQASKHRRSWSRARRVSTRVVPVEQYAHVRRRSFAMPGTK